MPSLFASLDSLDVGVAVVVEALGVLLTSLTVSVTTFFTVVSVEALASVTDGFAGVTFGVLSLVLLVVVVAVDFASPGPVEGLEGNFLSAAVGCGSGFCASVLVDCLVSLAFTGTALSPAMTLGDLSVSATFASTFDLDSSTTVGGFLALFVSEFVFTDLASSSTGVAATG